MNDGIIGVSRPRLDAPEKVTGETRYAADDELSGLLHARLVLSTEPHALIAGFHTEAALAVPGVVAVLRAADLPLAAEGSGRSNEPLAREEVVFAGQPVALVVAESAAVAEDGAEAVIVDYEPLETVLDLEEAMAAGAPLAQRPREEDEGSDLESVHAAVDSAEEETPEEELSGNVLKRAVRADGDLDAAFAESDAIVSTTFRTPWIYQAYIEPQTATAWIEPGSVLAVSTSTQGSFLTRRELSNLFGLPLDKVRVRPAPLGGAFGGKLAVVEPLAAGAALVLNRPVRLTFTRSEDFHASNPGPAEIIELRVGGRRDGTLTALEARILTDRGATVEWGIEDR